MRNFAEEISLMERSDWSLGQCLQTSNEVSTASSMLTFESLFPMWKCLLSREKFPNFYVEMWISKLISNVKWALCYHLSIEDTRARDVPRGSLCEKMESVIKPEVYNTLQRHQEGPSHSQSISINQSLNLFNQLCTKHI